MHLQRPSYDSYMKASTRTSTQLPWTMPPHETHGENIFFLLLIRKEYLMFILVIILWIICLRYCVVQLDICRYTQDQSTLLKNHHIPVVTIMVSIKTNTIPIITIKTITFSIVFWSGFYCFFQQDMFWFFMPHRTALENNDVSCLQCCLVK